MPKAPSAHQSEAQVGATQQVQLHTSLNWRLCMHAAARQRMQLGDMDWSGVPGSLTGVRAATSCHKSPVSPEGLAPMQAGPRVLQHLICDEGGRHQPAPASQRLILCSQVQRDGALGDALLLLLQMWHGKACSLHDIPHTCKAEASKPTGCCLRLLVVWHIMGELCLSGCSA